MVCMLYDVLELKKVLLDGQNFFVFEEFLYLCGCATPMGSGVEERFFVRRWPFDKLRHQLRLLLCVSPSETFCSFTPTGFIYSVYLYQGLASPKLLMLGNWSKLRCSRLLVILSPLPVVYHSYGVYYKIICCEWIYLLFNVRYITDEMWMDMIKKMLSHMMDSAFFVLFMCDLRFAEVVDAVLEGFDFGFGIGLFFALVFDDFGFGIGYEFFVAELFHYRI